MNRVLAWVIVVITALVTVAMIGYGAYAWVCYWSGCPYTYWHCLPMAIAGAAAICGTVGFIVWFAGVLTKAIYTVTSCHK